MNPLSAPSAVFKKLVKPLIGVFLSLCLAGVTTSVSALMVTVSIPPLAGIIAPLLGPQDELHVVLKPGVSPHGFQLKPSHVKRLQDSDLVITVGTPVDAWIERPLQLVNKTPIAMAKVANVERLALRQGGLWEKALEHEHDSEEHAADNHAAKPALEDQVQRVEDAHLDGHLWMSLHNAQQMVQVVSQRLQKMQPGQKQVIQQRTADWLEQLEKTNQAIIARLATVQTEPFLVLHDAFQYFEHQYALNGVGSIRLNPQLAPSLKRVQSLRTRIKDGGVTCLFTEPQFPEKRVLSVVSGLNVKLGGLDPMGTSYSIGTPFMAYDAFLETLANQFSDCLIHRDVQ
jgi:zinc transport system substrate-binding protein